MLESEHKDRRKMLTQNQPSQAAPTPRTRARLPKAEGPGETALIPVKLCNLPPFHPVASQLLSSDEGGLDMKRIASLVGGDPALAAEILFVANSSLFGFPARIESLRHAVVVLGANCVRQLAMTVAMRALARGAGSLVRSCWGHSVACAVIAEKVAAVFGCTPEQAYTAGLLHDVGRLGFLRSYPGEIRPVLSGVFENAEEVIEAERAVLNASHAEAGAWLIEYWALPVTFSETCAHHHDAPQEGDSPILRAVKTACRLADATGYSAVQYTSNVPYAEVLQLIAPEVPVASFPSEQAVRDEVETRLKVFR